MNKAGLEFLHVDCTCYHPGCAIRISRDVDGYVWVEFQTYHRKPFWSRLKDAFAVLFKKKPHNWAELSLDDESMVNMFKFLRKASPKVREAIEERERADHGVY